MPYKDRAVRRLKDGEYKQRRWRRYRALGYCRYCATPVARFTRCLRHRRYYAAYQRRRRALLRRAAPAL